MKWFHSVLPEKVTITRLVLAVSLFFVLFDNVAFFRNVTAVYPVSFKNLAYIGLTAMLLYLVIVLLLSIFCYRHTTKPILVVLLLISSLTGYFMDSYNIFIDSTMVQNILQTNRGESMDLLSIKLVLYFLLLGVLPALVVCRIKLSDRPFKKEFFSKIKVIAACLLCITAIFFLSSDFLTSFLREHKPLRYYTNPTYYIYSIGNHLYKISEQTVTVPATVGEDANIPESDIDRELIIIVVGEAARADRFSLNGYHRETNPLLKKEEIFNFPAMFSCGTTTAVSLPCMFSSFGRTDFTDNKGKSHENLLDVLDHAGVNILWRENNSSSKGVALRAQYEDFRSAALNPVCDVECRDEGMLAGLQAYIDEQNDGDILIVLHQMGNHGPAYYKRYPKKFERYTPTCNTNELKDCTTVEIGNAYDNAILYTDYFLSRVIDLLKQNTNRFETAMLYFSDHGESLGEHGFYLHGLPYALAPDTQVHIPAVFWFGKSFKIDREALRAKTTNTFSHDNLFHTIIGLMEIESSVYDKALDMIYSDRLP